MVNVILLKLDSKPLFKSDKLVINNGLKSHMVKDIYFKDFVNKCLNSHYKGCWGNIDETIMKYNNKILENYNNLRMRMLNPKIFSIYHLNSLENIHITTVFESNNESRIITIIN